MQIQLLKTIFEYKWAYSRSVEFQYKLVWQSSALHGHSEILSFYS